MSIFAGRIGVMANLLYIIKKWMLVVGMVSGASLYFIYRAIEPLHKYGGFLMDAVGIIQPCLIFTMLFLTFCKIEPKDIKPSPWQFKLLGIQCSLFIAIALLLIAVPGISHKLTFESAMICLICPTATACAVVTRKLGGDIAGVLTYTVFINLATAVLIPTFLPLIYPQEGMSFITAFWRILRKVFPMLILPCLAAWAVRYGLPKAHKFLMSYYNLPFYCFAVSLTLAITTATRIIVHNDKDPVILLDMALATMLCCAFQFWAGKRIGAKYARKIAAGQSLGQKNTVFAMWLGYTFLDPITSVAGGLYSIWHNIFNTYQMNKAEKEPPQPEC